MILVERSKFGLVLSNSSNFQVYLVSRNRMELFEKVVNLESEFLLMFEGGFLMNAPDLKGEVVEEETESMFDDVFVDDLLYIFEDDEVYIVLFFRLPWMTFWLKNFRIIS